MQTQEFQETREGMLADSGLLENTAKILDSLVPLRKASHADVVEYRVEIPMRYAECYAVLEDGRKVSFADPRKFLGWSSHTDRRLLLFRNNDIAIEVEVDNLAAERGAHLLQERRFADARIAAEQYDGSRHETTAEHPIELAKSGRETLRDVDRECIQSCRRSSNCGVIPGTRNLGPA